MTRANSTSTFVSLAIHGSVIALLLLTGSTAIRKLPAIPREVTHLIDPPPLIPRPLGIGGAGGQNAPTPATEGHLPKIARVFVPPMEVVNPQPKLAMEMSIEAPPEMAQLNRNLPNIGDPFSHLKGMSPGTGGPGGIGNAPGTSIGNSKGPAAGPGGGGTVYRPGSGVTNPVLIVKVEPEYSEEARKAKYSGSVLLQADVDANGNPRNIRVVRSVGYGLDEKAIEAVSKWRFKPGLKDGKPVAVSATVEVGFRLL